VGIGLPKVVDKITRLTKNKLFRGTSIMLVGTMIGNFLNYLYHFVTGRLLTPTEYGLLQSLISLTYFQSILVGGYSNAIVEKIASTRDKKVSGVVRGLEINGFKISIVYWLLTMFSYPLIKDLLHLEDYYLFLLFSFQSIFTFLPAVYASTLRGRLRFIEGTLVSTFANVAKLVSAGFLLYLGLGVVGGLGSWLVWKITGVILAFIIVRKLWPFDYRKKIIKPSFDFIKFSALSLIVNLSMISLYTTDIILVRHYFESNLVGIYSASSNLGKMIFFGSSTVLAAAFPLFVKNKVKKKKLRKLLALSLLFCLIFVLIGVTTFNIFPKFFVNLLYGKKYLLAKQYVGRFSLFLGLTAIFNLFVRFMLAIRNRYSAYLSAGTAICQIILIIVRHQDLMTIINNSLIIIIIGVILSSFLVLKLVYEFD
jgi:O-antigen/teichoic acid export membrane protein